MPNPSGCTSRMVAATWTVTGVLSLYERPLADLLLDAQQVHRQHFDPNTVQLSTLLSVKTGACPENCAYCPQSAHWHTGVEVQPLMDVEGVRRNAREAKARGATRFCMGGAWRAPRDRDVTRLAEMVSVVKDMDLESCVTAGMLTDAQARCLAAAGLDYYNHNLDTSEDYYGKIVSTRTYRDRLDTLERVRAAGIKVCCGGIVGMGETRRDRAALLCTLACMDPYPESVPINQLVPVRGTPLEHAKRVDPFEFIRTIAVARLLMPTAHVRLAAGRMQMSDEMQALCFMAGANSIFFGDRLLTTDNPRDTRDLSLLQRLGIRPEPRYHEAGRRSAASVDTASTRFYPSSG